MSRRRSGLFVERRLLGLMIAAFATTDIVSYALRQNPLQAPVFKGRIDIVRTDVAVVDNKTGKPVTGLTEREFTVSENGVRQSISSFLADAGAVTEHAAQANDHTTSPNLRVFLLIFGNGHLPGPVNPFDGAIHFVRERLRPGDLVGIMAIDRVTALTSDHEQAVQVVERLKRVPKEFAAAYLRDAGDISAKTQAVIDDWLKPPDAPADFLRSASALLVGTSEYRQNDQISRWNQWISRFDMLKVSAGIEYLRSLDGEKHLILISYFGLRPPFRLVNQGVGMRLEGTEDDRRLAARANDAKVALDIIHTMGTDLTSYGTMSSERVSELSGGQFSSLRTAEQQLARIDDATRNEYIIGYVPTNPDLDGKYRNVTVDVNRKNVTVIYRRGYTARPDLPSVEPRDLVARARLQEAAVSDMPLEDIKVQLKAASFVAVGGAREVRIDLRIDPSRLALIQTNGRWEGYIDLTIVCGDSQRNVIGKLDQHMKLSMSQSLFDQAKVGGIPYAAVVPVTGPATYVKAMVYDFDSDRIGTANVIVR